MEQHGFFGLLALLGALQAIMLMNAFALHDGDNYALLGTALLEIEKTGFERTEAEMLFDRAIDETLAEASFGKLEARQIKALIDRRVLDAANALGTGLGLCKTWGFDSARPALQGQGIQDVSKAIVIKSHGTAIVQYTITGGPWGNLAPCGKLSNGAYTQIVMIPAGYSAARLVVSP